jgi:hypothetical protein
MAKLRPLWTPGGARSSSRPAGVPSLVTGPLTNGVSWFEDFFATTLAPVSFGEGTVATPDTLTNVTPFGAPGWQVKETAGTTGLASQQTSTATTLTGCGLVVITSGTANLDAMVLEAPVSTGLYTTTASALVQFRVANGTATTGNYGWGLVSSSTAVGTDWLTNPDVTLLNTAAIVVTKHEGSYSGDAANDVVLRVYDSAAAYDASLLLQAGLAANTALKCELFIDSPNLLLYAYVNGVLIGTVALTGLAATKNFRPSFMVQGLGVGAKSLTIDSFYQETSRATAR